MFRLAALTLAATAAIALPACGVHSDADDVRHAVAGWFDAIADGRADDACDHLTPAGRAQLAAQGLPAGISSCTELADAFHDGFTPEQRAALPGIAIRRVILADRGTKAIIRDQDVTLPQGLKGHDNGRPTILRRIDGTWKIEDLG